LLAASLWALMSAPALSESLPSDLGASSLSGSYLAGRYAGKQREVDLAARYFGRALESDPENPVLVERTFIHALAAGNFEKAEELAQVVLDGNSDHQMSRIALGLKAVRANRHSEAREHFAKAAYRPVGELTAALLTAWSFAHERELPEALKALDALDSNEAFANFKLLHAGLIADLLGDQRKAEEAYKEAYKRAGTSLRVLQAYGNFLERSGRAAEAGELYDRFLSSTQRNPLIDESRAKIAAGVTPKAFIQDATSGMAEALFSLASATSEEQSLEVSLVYVQLALALKPDFPIAQVLLAEIYEDTQQYDKAIQTYGKIARDSPLRPSAEIQIAVNLDRLDKFELALSHLDALIANQPRNYDALIARGNLLRLKEKWVEAADAYSRALSLVGEPQRQHWTVLYFRGISYERAGQWEQAEQDFRTALKLEPDQPSVLNYLGYSLIEKGLNLDEAMQMVRKAVELKPNDGYIVDSLGWAYYQLGDYEEAVQHLERAVELRPEDPVINDHLGDAYWRVGRRLEAKFQWKHAKDNKPEPKDLVKIEHKLLHGLDDAPEPTPAQTASDPKKS
jgi:tetratricopeptide (TPR) repeat protein